MRLFIYYLFLGYETWELQYFRTGWEGSIRIHSVQTAGEMDEKEDTREDQGETRKSLAKHFV